MAVLLLDANVLVALAWPEHEFHSKVGPWFDRSAASCGWATCPLTEAAFVRILSNPHFSPRYLSPQNALAVLAKNLDSPHRRFWPDDIPLAQAVSGVVKRLIGHRQITDAYLVGLTLHHRGKLATLDRGIATWAPQGSVELLG